jgi:hypothetical protein
VGTAQAVWLFPRVLWAVLAVGEVLVNVWLALLFPGFAYQGMHGLGVHGRGLDWAVRAVVLVVALVTAVHMVRLVLDRDERSWAWRQAPWPHPGRRPDAI